ncbi:MAG: XRE family transcriptional regulator [Myxococcaceae bacterium]|nr:MAG: XRE family transcriptional regulator [Myxococcaceae bacterium]
MAAARESKHAHGPSEAKTRVGVVRAVAKERRRLGARLLAMRLERELTREQAAEVIGIHAVHVARIETGSANVTIGTLVAVALAYKVPLAAFFEALPETT